MLEEVAREAGAPDWGSFLENPMPLKASDPAQQTDADIPDGPDGVSPSQAFPAEEECDALWDKLSFRCRLLQFSGGALLFALALMFTMPRVWDDWYLAEPRYFREGVGILTVIAATIVSLPASSALCSAGVMLYAHWKGHYSRKLVGKACRIAGGTTIPPLLAVIVSVLFLPHLIPSVSLDDAIAMQEDHERLMPIEMNGQHKGALVSSIDGYTRRIAIVMVDMRSIPVSMRETAPFGSEEFQASFPDHPVMRLTAALDCRTGIYLLDGAETTTSAFARTAMRYEFPERRERTLTDDERQGLCRTSFRQGDQT
jgi:hypothetical protein